MHWKMGAKEFWRFILHACSIKRVKHPTKQQDVVVDSSDTVVIDTLRSKKNSISISRFTK
jgi:hypothetical protein